MCINQTLASHGAGFGFRWIVIHFVQFSNLSRDSELDMVLKAFVDDVQGPETGIAFADIRTAADMQDFVVGLVQALCRHTHTHTHIGTLCPSHVSHWRCFALLPHMR